MIDVGTEPKNAERTRAWVREYRAAMRNIGGTVWRSDLETREISWEGKSAGKLKRKKTYSPKQKINKNRVDMVTSKGAYYEMPGQDQVSRP